MVKSGNEEPMIKGRIKVTDKSEDKCENCNGTGSDHKTGEKCGHCRGKGYYSQ